MRAGKRRLQVEASVSVGDAERYLLDSHQKRQRKLMHLRNMFALFLTSAGRLTSDDQKEICTMDAFKLAAYVYIAYCIGRVVSGWLRKQPTAFLEGATIRYSCDDPRLELLLNGRFIWRAYRIHQKNATQWDGAS